MSVRAVARIGAAVDSRGATSLPVLESDGPLALRRTRAPRRPYARVTVVGAMSAPLGGDRLAIEARVEEDAWLTVDSAAATVALVLRDEQILGRHGESSGTLTSRLTVHRAGRPLIDQQAAYGPGAPGGWDGPAVLGGHRAVGQLLLVDPSFDDKCPEVRLLGATAVLTPLAGPAVLVTALGPDARLLRATLDSAMNDVLGASAE
ncbi:urease accessory protein UreD [Streptomyces sp. NPDC002540]